MIVFFFFSEKYFKQNRKGCNDDDRDGDCFNMIFEVILKSFQHPSFQKMTAEHHATNPAYATENIVENKNGFIHFYHTGDNGSECPQERKKLGQEDGPFSVAVIKLFCPDEMIFSEQPGFSSLI